MDVQLVPDQVDGPRRGITFQQGCERLGELRCLSIRRGTGEMSASFRLDPSKDIGRATALIVVILFGNVAGR